MKEKTENHLWSKIWRAFPGMSVILAFVVVFSIAGTAAPVSAAAKKTSIVKTASGYYYYSSEGKRCKKKDFHYLNKTLDGVKFKGYYYFGGKDGKLYTKAGKIKIQGKWYYLNEYGRRYSKCWYAERYWLPNGTMAANQKLPDGKYVGSDGKEISKKQYKKLQFKQKLKNITKQYGGTWSIYVKDLKSGDVISINDKTHYPASTIKAFVMASTFDRINKKKISYNSTVKSLLREMITVSDNTACNKLVTKYNGVSAVNSYLKKNGYSHTEIHNGVLPGSGYFRDGKGSNKTSASDCGKLLESIENGTCVSKKYSKEMKKLLLAQTRTWKIPAGVPSGIKVANKTGETNTTQHDIAIVYGKKTTYVICVLASNVGESNGISGIRKISSAVYSYLN